MPLFGPPNIEKMKEKGDASGLAKALEHKEVDIRFKAAEALGNLGRVDGVQPLITALKDESSRVRDQAARALGLIADQQKDAALQSRIVDALLPLLESQDLSIRSIVIEILGRLGSIGVDGLLKGLALKKAPISSIVVPLGKSSDPRGREAVIRIMQDENIDPHFRLDAAVQLLAFGKVDRRAVIFLSGLLVSPDARLAREAFNALEGPLWAFKNLEGDQPAVENALLAALNSKEVDVQRMAMNILAMLKSRLAVEPLLKSLGSLKPELRAEAADALGAIGDNRAVDALVKLLSSKDHAVIMAARTALERNDWLAANAEARLATALDKEDWLKVLAEVGPAMSDFQEALARVQKSEGRAALIRLLAEKGDPRWREAAIQGLKDPTIKARQASAALLEANPQHSDLEALLESLHDEDKKVRLRTLRALGKLADQQAAPALAGCVGDRRCEEEVRQEAILALTRLGNQGNSALAGLLETADKDLCHIARQALKRQDAPELEPGLSAWLGLADGDTERIIQAGEVGEEMCVAVLSHGKYEHLINARDTACHLLARRATPRAITTLVGAICNLPEYYQPDILRFLASEKNPAAVEPLAALLGDPALEVLAALALAEYGDQRASRGLIRCIKGHYRSEFRIKAARFLVDFHRSGLLGEAEKQEVLGLREVITTPHHDMLYAQAPCGFGTGNNHDDSGIGVEFRL